MQSFFQSDHLLALHVNRAGARRLPLWTIFPMGMCLPGSWIPYQHLKNRFPFVTVCTMLTSRQLPVINPRLSRMVSIIGPGGRWFESSRSSERSSVVEHPSKPVPLLNTHKTSRQDWVTASRATGCDCIAVDFPSPITCSSSMRAGPERVGYRCGR